MKNKNKITVFAIAVLFLGLTLWNLFGEKEIYSESERRALAKFPDLSINFGNEFEEYAVDAFPMRDVWRRIKVYVSTGIFAQKDNHGLYTAEGHISKVEYPMNEEMLDYATQLFQKVRDMYLEDNQIFLSIIPDKNYYLAKKNGYLSMDYSKLIGYMTEKMDYAKYIDITDLLEAEDYYYTDTHWRQEKIEDVAIRLASEMGTDVSADYTKVQLQIPFRGVYLGQSALIHDEDTIVYLENDLFDRIKLEGADAFYDMKKANGKDAYEMFLSGNQPIVTMKDEDNHSGKRLIVFRDSFASSLAPLLMTGYSEIVLVDLRYISSDMLSEYVDFKDADVLFLYSSLMLNQPLGMK